MASSANYNPDEMAQHDSSHIMKDGYIKQRWSTLDTARASILTRCEQYAAWTIPHAFPYAGINATSELQLDYQSFGSQAVSGMANRLGLTLITPHRPFFRMELSQDERAEMGDMQPAMIDYALSQAELAAKKEHERLGLRAAVVDAAKLLLITGNALLEAPEPDSDTLFQTLNMRRYVVKRDPTGKLLELIIQKVADLRTFSQDEQLAIMAARTQDKDKSEVELYTYIVKGSDNKYHMYQAADEWTLPNIHGIYTKDNLPFIPLVWNRIDGEDYGRGLVEDYSGDFHAIAGLYEATTNYSAVLADIKFLSDPRANNDIDTLNNSATGTYVAAQPDTIRANTHGLQSHLQDILQVLDRYERRVGLAFLMNSSMVRDAERVTAEEIRFMQNELEAAHAAVFSSLTIDLQSVAKLLMQRLDLGDIKTDPTIVTGTDSLARSADVQAWQQLLNDLLALGQMPPELLQMIKIEELIAIFGTGYGVDYQDIIKTQEELQAEQEQQAQAIAQQEAAQAAGQAAGEQAVQGQV